MKKSELRKIIRESIKELMTEQSTGGEIVRVRNCYNQNYSGGTQIGFGNVDFACVPAGTQTGDKMVLSQSSFFNLVGPGDVYVVEAGPQIIHPITGNNSCINVQSVTPLSGPCYTCCQYEDGTNFLPQPGSSYGCCPSQTTQAGSCNPSAWNNHANWTNTFTNTVANHNNPCNFLNQKIAQFTANLQGTGQGNYQNMQNCKLDLANQLHASNNC